MPEATNLEMTCDIVSSFVATNEIEVSQIADLIRAVYKSLTTLGQPNVAPEVSTDKATAAQIRKSIRPDGLISFVDGKSYKTLKRHLSKHGLTLSDYREKFGLPADYPSTAPDYSARRSEMARTLGLGRVRGAKAAPVKATKVSKKALTPGRANPKTKAKAAAAK